MPTDTIISKLELREAQLKNLEKSGFFTDKEIEKQAPSLRLEIAYLRASIQFINHSELLATMAENFVKQASLINVQPSLYGMTPQQYEEGKKIHDSLFSPINAITVAHAQILTPNQQEA